MMVELSGKEKLGRFKWMIMYVVNEDRQVVGISEQDAEDRKNWKQMICCG